MRTADWCKKGRGSYFILGGLWLVNNEDELNSLFYFEEQKCLCLISWLFQSNQYFCLRLETNEEVMKLKKSAFDTCKLRGCYIQPPKALRKCWCRWCFFLVYFARLSLVFKSRQIF